MLHCLYRTNILEESFSSNCVIVENFLVRLCELWAVFAQKYHWSERLYDDLFSLTVGFTNFQVLNMPLRCENEERYSRICNRLAHITTDQLENRRRIMVHYRERRGIRLNQQFRSGSSKLNNTLCRKIIGTRCKMLGQV